LALLVACADEKAGLEGKGGHTRVSSRVHAVCAWYPATDFTKRPGVFLSGKGQTGGPGEFIGGTLEAKPEACKQATIATHVSRVDPPALLIHGTKDPITPFWQSESLFHKMKETGLDVTLIAVQNAGHGFGPANAGEVVTPSREELFRATLEFFDKHLKSRKR
jgi:dipeptidyl aminopeptidase/acylaminoacyl peptidase